MGKPEELSNAQCLRVIGQYLDAQPINSFHLTTFEISYIVSSEDLVRQPPAGLLPKLARKLFGIKESAASDYVIFTRPEIHRLDTERRAERKPGSPVDRRDLSFVLRVLGDYLDRKNVREFAIQWSKKTSPIARYGNHEERFNYETLYNFGIRMYLRRAGGSSQT